MTQSREQAINSIRKRANDFRDVLANERFYGLSVAQELDRAVAAFAEAEEPKAEPPTQKCPECGATMMPFGTCDMSCGGVHQKDEPPVTGATPEQKKCINFKLLYFQCPSCVAAVSPAPTTQTEKEK